MRAMFYCCARVIEHALSARREYMTKDGQIVDGGLTTTTGSRERSTSATSWPQAGPTPKQPRKQERRQYAKR
jgi:hypothetical protein